MMTGLNRNSNIPAFKSWYVEGPISKVTLAARQLQRAATSGINVTREGNPSEIINVPITVQRDGDRFVILHGEHAKALEEVEKALSTAGSDMPTAFLNHRQRRGAVIADHNRRFGENTVPAVLILSSLAERGTSAIRTLLGI